jgi:hypothetical protein
LEGKVQLGILAPIVRRALGTYAASLPLVTIRVRDLRRRRFQAARLHHGFAPNEPDDISDFVSDELNGINHDGLAVPFDFTCLITDQPGTVCTKVPRHFNSLWEIIFENALSRIWLGVYWRFDAAAAAEILVPASGSVGAPYQTPADSTTAYKDRWISLRDAGPSGGCHVCGC